MQDGNSLICALDVHLKFKENNKKVYLLMSGLAKRIFLTLEGLKLLWFYCLFQ